MSVVEYELQFSRPGELTLPSMSNSDYDLWEEFGSSDQRLIQRDALKPVYRRCKSIPPEEKKDKHRRGYVFQNLIYSMLYHESLYPRTSYRPKGEEIDGAFYLNHRTFLLEAKWTADPTPASEIYRFKGKVDGKLVGTLGIFISMSGYSEDAPEALEQGKTPSVVLFDQSDMDAIFISDTNFVEVLDFKLRQAGEVGKTYVPFQLPKVIEEMKGKEVVVGADQVWRPDKVPTYAQVDLGYGQPVILVLCEGPTDALILESILRRLIAAERMYFQVAIEIKSLGGLRALKRLPETINIVQYRSGRQLSGVVVVLDTPSPDFLWALELGEQVEEYISQMAIPVPVHLSFAMPSTEAWVGLDRGSIPSGAEGLRLVQDAVDKIDLDELLGIDEVKATVKFIREVTEPEEPLWIADAREAVESALENAEWDPEKGIVTIQPLGEKEPAIECKSIGELRSELMEIASIGATNSMPYEGGEPVFDVDYWGLVDEILIDDYEKQIREMGWEL
ncbi:MAG: hypothetical protein E3J81_10290 [Dehalococcoidia bacterium]|nr:MAG: hypothetical protein E3J81_10290 [Dehalococcoidia bacterium]